MNRFHLSLLRATTFSRVGMRLSLVLSVFSMAALPGMAGDWPQWRGPNGQGHASATGLPLVWSETKNIGWKTAIPGRGWSSPVIEGDEIWMTTAFETPATPEDIERRLKKNTGQVPVTVVEAIRLHAICVDRKSGRVLHNIPLLRVQEPQWVHQLNSYASPSPVIEGGRLYCHFGAFGTVCVDTKKASVVWKNTDLVVMHENGPGSTPVLWKDLLIFHMDGSDEQYVAALDKRTGKVAWRTKRSGELREDIQLRKSYGTPLVTDIRGEPRLISPGADWLYSYDPGSGSELSKLNYGALGFSISPRPVAAHGLVYMSTGFMKAQLLAVRWDAAGQPKVAWRYKRGVPAVPSPLVLGDEIYFVHDSTGIVTCLDAHTGEEHYRERLGGNFWASPTAVDGKIYVSNREGETIVLAPGKQFKVLAKNQLDGKHFASFAVVDEALYVRTDTALYRIEEKRN